MNVLVVGAGGREHALAWKLKQSSRVTNVFVAPGNAGTARIATNVALSSLEEIIVWIQKNPVDLVVVGPDDYIALGLVDELLKLHVPVFGPTKAAGEIEWSKAFAKEFMREEGIPTAQYRVFTDHDQARAYVSAQSYPFVVKASGLALGKGVKIAINEAEACAAIDEIMGEKIFGEAGNEVVIEEFLSGEEVSVHAFCDGDHAVLFPAAQDHKRIFEGNQGPNTGGMGTIAPVPSITHEQLQEIQETIVLPTLAGLKKRDRTFRGILYPGIMMTADGPKVIEFNARFGDPEAQSYMRLLETDLIECMIACIDGTLAKQEIRWSHKSACCVVLASGGYPGKYEPGKVVLGLDKKFEQDIEIFHAGTKMRDHNTVTSGGRVLGVTAIGDTLDDALSKSYRAVGKISFEGMQFRRDIGAVLL